MLSTFVDIEAEAVGVVLDGLDRVDEVREVG
jgi:hypothetical protein